MNYVTPFFHIASFCFLFWLIITVLVLTTASVDWVYLTKLRSSCKHSFFSRFCVFGLAKQMCKPLSTYQHFRKSFLTLIKFISKSFLRVSFQDSTWFSLNISPLVPHYSHTLTRLFSIPENQQLRGRRIRERCSVKTRKLVFLITTLPVYSSD